jgi:DNA-binding transcriptional ArsR family regulator
VVGDRENEPGVVAEVDSDDLPWLEAPTPGREWVFALKSSRWKAGTGTGDDYSAYYKYDLILRERDDDGDLYRTPRACSLRVIPQFGDLNYESGDDLPLPYGEGSLVRCSTTWAESADQVEARMLDVLELVVDIDRGRLLEDRNDESRRIQKLEAHHRFDIGWKRQVVETIDQTRELIAYGGQTEISAHQERVRAGYLESVLDADRWHLLGFPRTSYDIELKCYQTAGWSEIPREDPSHHPKLEASFSGAHGDAALPHVDEWSEVLQTLREVVSSHLDWAGVSEEELVADDFQDGPAEPEYQFTHPAGRREQLRERYEAVGTEIHREALKANTQAVYDILRVVAVETGASYDMLEERTGLARSTIRYHVSRLQEIGVVDKVSNPVLVVFPSLAVLDEAEDILRRIYPDDQVDDMKERAEQRRERREDRDDPSSVGDGDQEESADDQDGDDEISSSWSYFSDLSLEVHQLANALERGYLDGDEVRVRTDRRSWVE